MIAPSFPETQASTTPTELNSFPEKDRYFTNENDLHVSHRKEKLQFMV